MVQAHCWVVILRCLLLTLLYLSSFCASRSCPLLSRELALRLVNLFILKNGFPSNFPTEHAHCLIGTSSGLVDPERVHTYRLRNEICDLSQLTRFRSLN